MLERHLSHYNKSDEQMLVAYFVNGPLHRSLRSHSPWGSNVFRCGNRKPVTVIPCEQCVCLIMVEVAFRLRIKLKCWTKRKRRGIQVNAVACQMLNGAIESGLIVIKALKF